MVRKITHKTTFITTMDDLSYIIADTVGCGCKFEFKQVSDHNNIHVAVYGLLDELNEFMFLSDVNPSAFSYPIEAHNY